MEPICGGANGFTSTDQTSVTDTKANGIPVEVGILPVLLNWVQCQKTWESCTASTTRRKYTPRDESRVNQDTEINPLQSHLLAQYISLWLVAEGFQRRILFCLMSLSLNTHCKTKALRNPAQRRRS